MPPAVSPCPEGRTLERQVGQADLVVLGKAALSESCERTVDPGDCLLLPPDAEITVEKSWKGPVGAGETILVSLPLDALQIKDAATVVVFAKLYNLEAESFKGAISDACMYPEGSTPTDTGLVKRLDAWHNTQKS